MVVNGSVVDIEDKESVENGKKGINGEHFSVSLPCSDGSTLWLDQNFIISDNQHSAAQMQSLMGSDSPSLNIRTVVAPSGCHMEFDHSKECHFFTVTQWFLLSLSNVLVTQTLPNSAATSSFSRYAGIYSLNPDVFRNGRDCDNVPEDVPMSRQPQSNWFC